MQVSNHCLHRSLLQSISVLTLLPVVAGIGYLALLQSKLVVPVGSDQDLETLCQNDWDLSTSCPKIVELTELINRTLLHFPSEFLPEYCVGMLIYTKQTSLSLRCLPYFFLIGFPKCGTTEILLLPKGIPLILVYPLLLECMCIDMLNVAFILILLYYVNRDLPTAQAASQVYRTAS